jgi:hypothetical protein
MKNDTVQRRPVIGLLTLLVIFSVLCLTILAILSYSTAKYERGLAQKNADSAAAYYKADSWCTDAVNDLHSVWKAGGDLGAEAAKYGGTYKDGVITLACQVDDARLLTVTVAAAESFEVTAWNTVSAGDWAPDESLHVWSGD